MSNNNAFNVSLLGGDSKYVETTLKVSDKAFAIRAENDDLKPIILSGDLLIVDPVASLNDRKFLVIDEGGHPKPCLAKISNEMLEGALNFESEQYMKLSKNKVLGAVVHIKREARL